MFLIDVVLMLFLIMNVLNGVLVRIDWLMIWWC